MLLEVSLVPAAALPLVTLSGRGGQLVELNPPLLQSFDRFVADAMSGHDMIYQLTLERMAREKRRAVELGANS